MLDYSISVDRNSTVANKRYETGTCTYVRSKVLGLKYLLESFAHGFPPMQPRIQIIYTSHFGLWFWVVGWCEVTTRRDVQFLNV